MSNVKHIFVVDTDSYSGNFEREMTAFCTGVIGDCGVGKHLSNLFKEDCPEWEYLSEKVLQVEDDEGNGCYRPAAAWPTPNRYNDGRGGHFDGDSTGKYPAYESVAMFFNEPLTQNEIDFLKQRAVEFGASNIKIIGFRMINETVTTMQEEIQL